MIRTIHFLDIDHVFVVNIELAASKEVMMTNERKMVLEAVIYKKTVVPTSTINKNEHFSDFYGDNMTR